MAYETGTATDYTDLYNKLVTFLTTNAALVSASQNWTVVRATNPISAGAELDKLLRGPGLAGADNIYLRLYTNSNPGADIYGLACNYFTAYNSTLGNHQQPGISSDVGMALWNNVMSYWFIANGRRFIVVAKVSTTYSSMYAGFLLPYSTPSEYPYPIIILGSHPDATTYRWSTAAHVVGGFWDTASGNGFMRYGDGVQLSLANYVNGTGNSRQNSDGTNIWPYDYDLDLRENLDNSQTLLPCVVHTNTPTNNVFGELQGAFFTSAFGLGSEDTVTIGADTYLIVQSVYRTTRLDYCAIKLE